MKAKTIKNEIPDVILMMTERYSNRLKLSIIKGRYIGRISGRDRLQNRIFMEAYVREKGWSSYLPIMLCIMLSLVQTSHISIQNTHYL